MNPRLWTLPDDIAWMGDVKIFYNRECYEEIIEKAASKKLILIKGTPGIGKSLFLQSFLVHLVNCARQKGEDIPSIHYKCNTDVGLNLRSQTFSLLPDGKVIEIVGNIQTLPNYLLSDSVDIFKPYGRSLNMEVASDKAVNYKEFQKRMSEYDGPELEVETIIMPLFTFQELLCIKPATMDDNVAQFRYDLYGGSARNFKNPGLHPSGLKDNKYVELEMTFFFGDSVATKYPDEWARNIRKIASKLQERSTDGTHALNTISSMMIHTNGEERIWASRFMGFLAASVQSKNDSTISEELKKLFSTSGVGYLFEAMGHKKLLKSDESYMLKPLLIKLSWPNIMPEFPSFSFNYPVSLIRNVEDIGKLPEKYYGLPMTCNFPLVDAIIQPNTLIQFTISPRYHSGAKGCIDKIRDQLTGSRATHQMIFVVPQSSGETFLHQSGLGDILQFMCFDDFTNSSTVLMSVNERKSWISADKDEPDLKRSRSQTKR